MAYIYLSSGYRFEIGEYCHAQLQLQQKLHLKAEIALLLLLPSSRPAVQPSSQLEKCTTDQPKLTLTLSNHKNCHMNYKMNLKMR